MRVSLVISTYNEPAALRRCLLGVSVQTRMPDQIVVSDDGSADDTRHVLFRAEFAGLPLEHVWQEDAGWRKPRVMNLSLAHCTGDYVIFCDGDCVPRSDFIASHLRYSRPRTFLSGSIVDVPPQVHPRLTDEQILDNSAFSWAVLESLCPRMRRQRLRLHPGRWEPLLNLVTHRYCTLRGSNFSVWRVDLLRVNGCDENFGYGSEDRELGVRLRNAGVSSRWLKYSLVQLHLGHARHPDAARLKRQRRRFRRLFFTGATRVEPGIDTAVARGRDAAVPSRHVVVGQETEWRSTVVLSQPAPPVLRRAA
jgi:glycosyltransferase involved in cell wall biosynthesis